MLKIDKNDISKMNLIGSGTDGFVYKYNNKYLVKIYRSFLKTVDEDSPMKIYNIGDYKKMTNNYNNGIGYYDNENVRLMAKDGLKKAIEKQENVKLTQLPTDIVYIDNKFSGCLVTKVRGVQIHKLSFLPMSFKMRIVEKLIDKLKELYANNIYHVDLSNSPFVETAFYNENNKLEFKYGHSHVLVDLKSLTPYLIDLDGKSTKYTESFNEHYYEQSLHNLFYLVVEFLVGSRLDDELIEELNNRGFDCYVDKLYDETLTIEDIENLADDLSKKRI